MERDDPMSPPERGPAEPDRVVIRPEELTAQPEAPAPPPPNAGSSTPRGPSQQLPPLGTPPPTVHIPTGSANSGSGLTKLGANSVMTGLVGGAVGGLAGAILSEVLYSPNRPRGFSTPDELRVQTGIWVAIVGAVIGFVLLAWDGITSGSPEKGFREGSLGAVAGAIAGFLGGYLAQIVYSEMLRDATFDNFESRAVMARMIAWGIFGVLLGGGLGIKGGSQKIVNGLIGGGLGGAAGGLLFQLLENSGSGGDSGTGLRVVGVTCTGVGIGLGIGLVERARREAWITITAGPMSGKEFILYNDQTLIGADHHCHIVLVRDPNVAPQHLSFDRSPQGTDVRAIGGAVLVNGTSVNAARLRAGDQVAVGSSVLSYQERAASAGV